MSQETFDANEAVIRAGVEAIMRNPEWRRSSRIFELHETHTGELLAGVFRTAAYGPVIAHRSYGSVDRLRIVVVPGPVPDPTRRGRGTEELVVASLTDNPDQRFPIMALNFKYWLPVRNFLQWIAEGKTRHDISYRVAPHNAETD
jgi:hypothetical protein